MQLAEYMRKNHPAPLTYIEPLKHGGDVLKHLTHVSIPIVHIEIARAFVMCSIIGAVCLPGKWGVLSGVIGNAYWLYKIR